MPSSAVSTSRRALLRAGAMLGAGAFVEVAGLSLPVAPALARGSAGPDGLAAPGGNWPRVAELVSGHVRAGRVSGMIAALGWGTRLPEYVAAGTLSLTSSAPITPDSLFRIYSMTKPITGIATILCIEDGLLGLDQPLAEILPDFATMQVQRHHDGPITPDNLEPAARPITIRHLLTHTAGLGYAMIQRGPIRQAYARAGLIPGQVSRLPLARAIFGGDPAPSLAAFAAGLARVPLVHQPGTRWSYSVGLDLLGHVIEVVSGQSFDAFLAQRILGPCSMDSTYFTVPESERARLTANYFVLGGALVPLDLPGSSVFLDRPPFPFGGAGLVSSARDYDRFLAMLAGGGAINGRRVMSGQSLRLATGDLFPATLAADGGFASGGRRFGFGAGGLVGRGDAQGLFGWFGAAGTAGLVNLRHGLRHSLMTQYMPAEALDLQTRFPVAVALDAADPGPAG